MTAGCAQEVALNADPSVLLATSETKETQRGVYAEALREGLRSGTLNT